MARKKKSKSVPRYLLAFVRPFLSLLVPLLDGLLATLEREVLLLVDNLTGAQLKKEITRIFSLFRLGLDKALSKKLGD